MSPGKLAVTAATLLALGLMGYIQYDRHRRAELERANDARTADAWPKQELFNPPECQTYNREKTTSVRVANITATLPCAALVGHDASRLKDGSYAAVSGEFYYSKERGLFASVPTGDTDTVAELSAGIGVAPPSASPEDTVSSVALRDGLRLQTVSVKPELSRLVIPVSSGHFFIDCAVPAERLTQAVNDPMGAAIIFACVAHFLPGDGVLVRARLVSGQGVFFRDLPGSAEAVAQGFKGYGFSTENDHAL